MVGWCAWCGSRAGARVARVARVLRVACEWRGWRGWRAWSMVVSPTNLRVDDLALKPQPMRGHALGLVDPLLDQPLKPLSPMVEGERAVG